MRASILNLRKNMGAVIDALDMNEIVTLTYRGKEKAKIIPVGKQKIASDITAHGAFGIWADKKQDVVNMVRDMRKGRVDAF